MNFFNNKQQKTCESILYYWIKHLLNTIRLEK